MLKTEFDYYRKHQDELVKQYNGKFLAIIGEEVVGVFETELEAYTEMKKSHTVGTFFIQLCSPGKESYTQTFHSRVAFN